MVDDDAAIRNLISKVAERAGLVTDTARDGEEGIELIEKGGYEIILLDLMMPKVSGFEVVEQVRKSRPADLKKIVIITASPRVMEGRINLDEVGDILHKPFDIFALAAYLKEKITAT